jgi:hypothetical protein
MVPMVETGTLLSVVNIEPPPPPQELTAATSTLIAANAKNLRMLVLPMP